MTEREARLLELLCERVNEFAYNIEHKKIDINNIGEHLCSVIEVVEDLKAETAPRIPDHENIRGAEYYK